MNRGIIELIDMVELAVSRSNGCAPRSVIAEAQRRVDGLRNRNGHFGEVLVIALAGGTGGGKSSLLNAIAGEDVAGVSVLRPHTQTPLAWIPRDYSEGIERLLDELDISQRVVQDLLPSIAFLDLPDMDSISDWHRQMVEEVIPHVDAVLWVVDNEKYRDEVLHEHFLSPVAAFGEQFIFVLNKIDRLSVTELDEVRDDLVASLGHDGFKRPIVFAVAADPEVGPLRGIEELTEYLAEQVDVKRVAISKALSDVAVILEQLGSAANVWEGGFVEFDRRWLQARALSAAEIMADESATGRDEAICRLEDLIAAVAVEVGPTLGAVIRDEFPSGRIEAALDARPELGPDAVRTMESRLDSAIGEPLRVLLWRRAQFAATLAGAVVATRQLEFRHANER